MKKSLISILVAFAFAINSYAFALSATDIYKNVVGSVGLISTGKKIGTGFFINGDGLMLTNYHVIAGAERVVVKLADGKTVSSEGICYVYPDEDLAIIKISGNFIPVTIGKSDAVEIGHRVYVLGNPEGLANSFSEGILSGRRVVGPIKRLQITAAISPGSSGSPLLNDRGEVIGVVVSQSETGQALNFAIPIEKLNVELNHKTIIPFGKEKTAFPVDEFYSADDLSKMIEYFDNGDFSAVLKISNHLLSKYPNSPRLLAFHAVVLTGLQFKDELEKCISQLESKHANDSYASFVVASYYLTEKADLQRARPFMKKALEGNLTDDAYACFGSILTRKFQSDCMDEGMDYLKQALQINPNNSLTWSALGLVYSKNKAYDMAEQCYQKVVTISPDDSSAWADLGGAYLDSGKNDRAINAYNEAIKNAVNVDNNDIREFHIKRSLFGLGCAYAAEKKYSEAIKCHTKVIDLDPKYKGAWMGLSAVYGELGEYAKSQEIKDRYYSLFNEALFK